MMDDNQFLKYVMQGMGVQPSDNMQENWNTILNFVPSYTADYAPASNINGPIVKLIFEYIKGGNPVEIDCSETMLLKDAFAHFSRIKNLSNESLNKITFLCDGRNFHFNAKGTIKENNLKNGSKIIVTDLN